MCFARVIFVFTLALSIFGTSHVMALPSPSDLDIFQSCFGNAPIDQCTNADFNKDGLINAIDLGLFRGVPRGDFNHDNITDVRIAIDNQDLNFLSMCIEQNTQAGCELADLNNDALINNLDLDVFNGYIIFDLNNDSIIDFNTNTRPTFLYAKDVNINETKNISFYIWAKDTSEDTIIYTLDTVPVPVADTALFTPIIIKNFNNDAIVDDQDVSLIENRSTNNYEQRFDLNNDNQVGQEDIDLVQQLVGTVNQALVFDWSPGNRDSGFYEILITAADAAGLTSQMKIKLTVYDIDAYTNYYSYDDVLLVVNDQSAASQTIGDYFAASRGIPASRIVSISTAENETIDRQTFEQDIRLPVENFILNNKLDSEVNYIVTTKGVPLRITSVQTGADHASVDSELSLILGPYADQIGAENAVQNPYENVDFPFSREMFGIYLATRLTGYSVNDVITLIDRSAQPEQFGTFVLDVDSTKDTTTGFTFGNQWLREAAGILENTGHFVLLDETTSFVTNQTSVLGYASWGSNDANTTDNGKPKFDWLPGSIAETYVSTSARTFTSPAVYGQSLVADLIAEGATGVKGYVYEPFLSSMAKPNILFDRYAKGYTLADSYFSASSSLGWQDVVIGDPKMAISDNIQSLTENNTQPTQLNNSKGSGSMDPWVVSLLLLLVSIQLIRHRKEIIAIKGQAQGKISYYHR